MDCENAEEKALYRHISTKVASTLLLMVFFSFLVKQQDQPRRVQKMFVSKETLEKFCVEVLQIVNILLKVRLHVMNRL